MFDVTRTQIPYRNAPPRTRTTAVVPRVAAPATRAASLAAPLTLAAVVAATLLLAIAATVAGALGA